MLNIRVYNPVSPFFSPLVDGCVLTASLCVYICVCVCVGGVGVKGVD